MTVLKQYAIKTHSRRSISVEKRDIYSLNALDRLNIKSITLNIALILRLFLIAEKQSDYSKILWNILLEEVKKVLRIIIVPNPQAVKTSKMPAMNFEKMESMLQSMGVSCSERLLV